MGRGRINGLKLLTEGRLWGRRNRKGSSKRKQGKENAKLFN
jgi:hypothetical protein